MLSYQIEKNRHHNTWHNNT